MDGYLNLCACTNHPRTVPSHASQPCLSILYAHLFRNVYRLVLLTDQELAYFHNIKCSFIPRAAHMHVEILNVRVINCVCKHKYTIQYFMFLVNHLLSCSSFEVQNSIYVRHSRNIYWRLSSRFGFAGYCRNNAASSKPLGAGATFSYTIHCFIRSNSYYT